VLTYWDGVGYQHRLLIIHGQELKRLIPSAIQAHIGKLEQLLSAQVDDAAIADWATQLPKPITSIAACRNGCGRYRCVIPLCR